MLLNLDSSDTIRSARKCLCPSYLENHLKILKNQPSRPFQSHAGARPKPAQHPHDGNPTSCPGRHVPPKLSSCKRSAYCHCEPLDRLPAKAPHTQPNTRYKILVHAVTSCVLHCTFSNTLHTSLFDELPSLSLGALQQSLTSRNAPGTRKDLYEDSQRMRQTRLRIDT